MAAGGAFALNGTATCQPQAKAGNPSGVATVNIPLVEALNLTAKHVDEVTLVSDSVTPVSFGGLANASVVILQATPKVTAFVTSADGTSQKVPVDDLFVLVSGSVPITALDLQRVAGQSSTVEIFLGSVS